VKGRGGVNAAGDVCVSLFPAIHPATQPLVLAEPRTRHGWCFFGKILITNGPKAI